MLKWNKIIRLPFFISSLILLFACTLPITLAPSSSISPTSMETTSSSSISEVQVTFNSMGGSNVASKLVSVGSHLTSPSTTKLGYTFEGWYTSQDSGVTLIDAWDFNSDSVTQSITLYAKWDLVIYSIDYQLDGGINTSNPTTYSIEDNSITLLPSTKEGFTFGGWFDNAAFSGDPVTSISSGTVGNLTLYAKWIIIEITTYLVSFDGSGGTLTTSQQINANDPVDEPIDPEKEGSTFIGWFTSLTYDTLWDFDQDVVTASITLYAKWSVNHYTITFDSNDGSSVAPITQAYGSLVEAPANPTKIDSVFGGWFANPTLTQPYTFTTMPSTNITLYAQWQSTAMLFFGTIDTGATVVPSTSQLATLWNDRAPTSMNIAADYLSPLSKVYIYANLADNTGKNIKVGNSTAGGAKLEITFNNLTLISVTINAKVYGTDTDVKIKVNGSESEALTSTAKDYTFMVSGNVLTIENVGKRFYINSLSLTYSNSTSSSPTDTEAPLMSISNSADFSYTIGDDWSHQTALSWCTATDNVDAVVPCELDDSLVNTSVVGSYFITYTAKDTSNNLSSIQRVVTVSEIDNTDTLETIDYSGFSDYYTNLNESTNVVVDLAQLLRSTIDYVSYGDARYVYTVYANGSQVVLYDWPTSSSYQKVSALGIDGWGSGGVITTPSYSITLNREHVWACSDMRIMPTNGDKTLDGYVGFKLNDGSFEYRPDNTDRGHYTDLHNLWNSLASPNSTHSDHFFGEENGDSATSYLMNSIFYPGDEYKGDIARILFYMTLMYPHLTLVEKGSAYANEGSIYYGYLDVLLQWNEEDPVSTYELGRNNTIFSEQGNRNPFIDFYDQDFAQLLFALGDPNVLDQ